MTAYSPDPFSQMLTALWTILGAFPGFSSLVRLANQIRLDGTSQQPYKEELAAADLPEVVIEPAGGEVHYRDTFSSNRVVQKFKITAATDDLRFTKQLLPVKWAVNLSFVTNVNVTEANETAQSADADRGAIGPSGSIVVSVDAYFGRTDT